MKQRQREQVQRGCAVGTSGWLADLMLGAGMVLSAAGPHAAASPRRVPQALRGFFCWPHGPLRQKKKQGCSTSLRGSPVWLRGSAHGLPGFPEGCGSARGFLFLRSLRVVFQVQLGHQLVADDGQHLFQLLHISAGQSCLAARVGARASGVSGRVRLSARFSFPPEPPGCFPGSARASARC